MGELARLETEERRRKWVAPALAAAMLLAVGTALAVGAWGASGVTRPAAAAATEGALDVALVVGSAWSDAPDSAGADSPEPQEADVAEASAEEPPSAQEASSSASPAYPSNTSTVGVAPGPGSWSPRPRVDRVDWLHIPKCGTTFLGDLIRFNCDTAISGKLGQRDDAEALALEDINYKAFLRAVIHGGSYHSVCQVGLRYYHRPLSAQGGHYTTPVSRVVTFFRDPIARVASGFVHGLHDCSQVSRVMGMTTTSACNAFTNNNTSTRQLEKAKLGVLQYAKCVRGCQGRMVTGANCASGLRNSPRAEEVAARAREAVVKLQNFAFVGLTERWEASRCVFKRDFPRPSGRGYPEEAINMRPSANHQCEDKVAAYLRKSGVVDVLDSAVYDAALAEFSRRVGNCSTLAG
jgi:hypothetical protein